MFAFELRQELIETSEPADEWADASCRAETGHAKAICLTCPLIVPCLEGALERREPWGVWGGQLFLNGKVLAQKRRRGRPPKNPPADIQMTA